MMNQSNAAELKITSWNPFTGCTKVSAACKHCYAETLALKLHKWGTPGYENKFEFTVHQDRIEKAPPLKRRKPTLYFINSMSDLFHEDASDRNIDDVMQVVRQVSQHHFYLLTKRSNRMRAYFDQQPAPDNLWVGVTVEDKVDGLPRLKDLQRTQAARKHICCEPLLEDLGELDLDGINWVIGGGESGPHARQTELPWVESLQQQCQRHGVPFHWKSWGRYAPDTASKGKGVCLVNGQAYDAVPGNLMP